MRRRRSTTMLRLALAICAAGAGSAAAVAAAAGNAMSATVSTDRGCYRVNQSVKVNGAGFAPSRSYEVTIDDVDFGTARTDDHGAFSSSLAPGGLAAGVVQQVDALAASDGSSGAGTTFTLTRQTGAHFLVSTGDPRRLSSPFEVWGFAPDGKRLQVYVHYLTPTGRPRATVSLGQTGGQCGYLRTRSRRVFPFIPSFGTWVLQFDTSPDYSAKPSGPVARIRVGIRTA